MSNYEASDTFMSSIRSHWEATRPVDGMYCTECDRWCGEAADKTSSLSCLQRIPHTASRHGPWTGTFRQSVPLGLAVLHTIYIACVVRLHLDVLKVVCCRDQGKAHLLTKPANSALYKLKLSEQHYKKRNNERLCKARTHHHSNHTSERAARCDLLRASPRLTIVTGKEEKRRALHCAALQSNAAINRDLHLPQPLPPHPPPQLQLAYRN